MSSTVRNPDSDVSPQPPGESDCRHPCSGHTIGFAFSLNKKNFTDKTEGIQEDIFNIGPGQANRSNKTHRELRKYVQRKTRNSHDAAQEIKDLQAPTYGMQPYPSMAKSDPSDDTVSTPITEEEKIYAL